MMFGLLELAASLLPLQLSRLRRSLFALYCAAATAATAAACCCAEQCCYDVTVLYNDAPDIVTDVEDDTAIIILV